MNRIIRPVVLTMFLGLGLFAASGSVLAGNAKSAAETDMKPYEVQMDELIAKHEAFQIGIKDDPEFRKAWLTRLRLVAITKPKTAKTGNFVLSIGSEMMLDRINPYLRRSDDDSAIAFMQILAKIFSVSTKDEVICKVFLDSANDENVSDSDNERIENLFGPSFYEEMIAAIGGVMRAGKSGPEKILSESENERVIVAMFGVMMDTYGEDSVARMQTLDDKKVPSLEKCNTMMQMLDSISKLNKQDQAGLTRTLFASDDK